MLIFLCAVLTSGTGTLRQPRIILELCILLPTSI
jgi:hypothetical protein